MNSDEQWVQIAEVIERCAGQANKDPAALGEVVARGFAKLKRSQKDALASDSFSDLVRGHLRSITLREERRAEKPTAEPTPVDKPERRKEHWETCEGAWKGCTEPECLRIEERHQERVARSAATAAVIRDAFNHYKQELRMEWNKELLACTFALSDGRLVTWGEATVDEHRERVEMFMTNAHANMEGAARHEQAIDAIRDAGAATLSELREVNA